MLSRTSNQFFLRQVAATSRARPALTCAAAASRAYVAAASARPSASSLLILRPLPHRLFATASAATPVIFATPACRSGFHSTPRRLLDDKTRTAIDKAVASAPVVLFMKGTPELPQCGFSRATVQMLGLQGVDPAKFHAFNVLEDASLRSGIKEYSDWPTIPQLYVDGEFVGGCDILVTMHQNGELAKLLADKDVLALADPAASEDPAQTTSPSA